MAVSRSIFNIKRWLGATPNALQGGLVDARAAEVGAGLVGIKSVQGGYSSVSISTSGTVTLPTAVTVDKAYVILNWTNIENFDSSGDWFTVRLTGATTLTVTRRDGSGSATAQFRWQVVEFY